MSKTDAVPSPSASKVAKWVKAIIQIVIILASAIGGDFADIINLLNL